MTAKDMMAAYVTAAKKKEVEDYVEEVLEDMSDEDLESSTMTRLYRVLVESLL